jgi:ABC-type multidrug transport system ATPase subunit
MYLYREKESSWWYRLGEIIINNIHKSFGSIKALDGVNMNIRENEKVGIIGPNGAGKTTLLRIVLGILKPDKGYVTGVKRSPKFFGYVPQYPISYQYHRSAYVLYTALKLAGHPSKKIKEIAEELCRKNNIDPQSTGETLSPGKSKLLLFTMAVAKDPELLVLDEPTAMIDAATKKVIWDTIANYSKTMIMVTHSIEELRFVDRIFFLVKGRVVFEGSYNDFSKLVRTEGYVVEVKSGKTAKKIEIKSLSELSNVILSSEGADEITVRRITPEDIALLMEREWK